MDADAGDERELTARGRRALPLIAGALAAIVVASLIYLRAGAPPAAVSSPEPSPIPVLDSRFSAAYDFLTPSLGWSLVSQPGPDPSPLSVFKTTDGARHWFKQLNGMSQNGDMELTFLDRSHGLVTQPNGGTYFYRTRDGGAIWTRVELPAAMDSMTFADANHGWAIVTIAPPPGPMAPPTVQLMATSDGGDSWHPGVWPAGGQPGFKGGGTPRLAFRANGEGWLGASSQAPTVYLTNDGGSTWTSVRLPSPQCTSPAPAPDELKGLPGTPSFNTVVTLPPAKGAIVSVGSDCGFSLDLETLDGGQTWRAVSPPPLFQDFQGVSFLDSTHWWAAHDGFVYRTDDGGRSWRDMKAVLRDGWFYGQIGAIDPRHAWMVMGSPSQPSAAGLAMTSDGGVSWKAVNVPRPV
jgi:photosystem II stability/assembly factor-like uncharacterized protein